MNTKDSHILKLLKGLQPVDRMDFAEYERAMLEEGIPQIIKKVERRRMLAANSRNRQLEKPTDKKRKSRRHKKA